MFKKADGILIALVLVLALIAMAFMMMVRSQGSCAVVYVDGEKKASYRLDQDQTITIEGYQGGYNVLVIGKGVADVTEADCPDALCVHQSKIRYQGQTIVCLPHRVVVKIENGEEADVDSISG